MTRSIVDVFQELGRCCSCYRPQRESPNVNMMALDKYKTWEYPGWGNILAQNPNKRGFSRAISILCDCCIDEKNEPILAIEIYKEGAETRIRYHCVELLEDADPITEADYARVSRRKNAELMTQTARRRLKDYPLNEWMESTDGCDYCKAKARVMVTWIDGSGDYGEVHIQVQHENDCLDQEEGFGDLIDVAGWEYSQETVIVAGREWTPLKARANVGPCLNCGALVVGAPLILFLDEGQKGELDFCWNCAKELGILDKLTGGRGGE